MSQPREYQSASIEVTLQNGRAVAQLYGHYFAPNVTSFPTFWHVWNLPTDTVLTEYTKRCAAAQRAQPEMSPEQAEKVALLAWVKDMEAVAE